MFFAADARNVCFYSWSKQKDIFCDEHNFVLYSRTVWMSVFLTVMMIIMWKKLNLVVLH